jgi:hypothetical protein
MSLLTTTGRKPKSPHRAGVSVTLPRPLLDRIETYALAEFYSRAEALERLLEAGLRAEYGRLSPSPGNPIHSYENGRERQMRHPRAWDLPIIDKPIEQRSVQSRSFLCSVAFRPKANSLCLL